MEDLIYLILMAVVFLGPLLKKIFDSTKGDSGKKPSREEVRDYLERMRNQGSSSSRSTYQAPATRPKSKPKRAAQPAQTARPKESLEEKFNRIDKEAGSDTAHNKFNRIDQAVEHDIAMHVADHNYDELAEKPATARLVQTSNNKFSQLLNENEYTEFQKAVILSEIFGKPKALSKKSLI